MPEPSARACTFGELMNLWHERYGSRLRSETIKLSVEKHLRPPLGKLLLGGAAAALPTLLNSKIGELSPSTLNHLCVYCHRLYTVASMRSVGWWMGPNPVNRLELPKFKEPRRNRPTVAAEDVPSVAQKILRHANIETTLAIYTHLEGHARRGREARLRSAGRTRAGASGAAPKKRDLCYQFATGSLFPKRRGP